MALDEDQKQKLMQRFEVDTGASWVPGHLWCVKGGGRGKAVLEDRSDTAWESNVWALTLRAPCLISNDMLALSQ